MSSRPVVQFVTRSDCSLCDVARESVDRWARRLGLEVETVNVDGDDGLRDEFGTRVPVVRTSAGLVVAEGRWPSYRLGAALIAYRLASVRSRRGRPGPAS